MQRAYTPSRQARKESALDLRRRNEAAHALDPTAGDLDRELSPSDWGKSGNISRREQLRTIAHAQFREEKRQRAERAATLAKFESDNGLCFPAKGIVDTLSLSLLHPVATSDRRRLTSEGFEPAKQEVRAKRAPNGDLYDAEPGAELLVRENDGCSVRVYPSRVTVTASVARVLGLSNSLLHRQTEAEVMDAVASITARLLRTTTHVARVRGQEWEVQRIDLANDFAGDIREFIGAYSRASWKGCRRPPRIYPTSLVFRGVIHRLLIYGKGEEMRDRGEPNAPLPGTLVRVERRWTGARALHRLGMMMDGSTTRLHTLRLFEHLGPGGAVRMTRPFEHRTLHAILALELASLDPPAQEFHKMRELIASEMRRNPRFCSEVQRTVDPKTFRRYRRMMAEIDLLALGKGSLLQACYGRTPDSSSSQADQPRPLQP